MPVPQPDAPHLLDAEWKRKNVMPKIAQYYDHIWVYGPPDFYDPLVGLETPDTVRNKMNFVGFLQRNVPRYQMLNQGVPTPSRFSQYD